MATIDKRPNGNWRAQVRKTGSKPQTRTFKTKAQAEAWARGIEADLDRGVFHDTAALRGATVRELFERFRDEVTDERKGGRWERVRIEYLLRTTEFVHSRLDADLSGQIHQWVRRRSAEVSPESVNRELNLISGVFAYAVAHWRVPLRNNPVHGVARPKLSSRGREVTWTDAQVALFREALADTDIRKGRGIDFVLPAVELGIETAMRLGEICSLRVEDVHLDESWAHLQDTKNGDARDVPLSQRAVGILRPLVEVALKAGYEYVIPVEKDNLGVQFRKLRNKLGLAGLRFHDTRHTAATRLSTKLANVLELSAVTGHRSLQSLKRYYNPKAAELAKKLG